MIRIQQLKIPIPAGLSAKEFEVYEKKQFQKKDESKSESNDLKAQEEEELLQKMQFA